MIRSLRGFIAILLVALVAPLSVQGQSALVTQGLGFPVEPQDARSRGLGGVGIGLPDGEMSWISPGGLFGLPAPAMVASYQYDSFETSDLNPAFSGRTARLPFVMGAFPVSSRFGLFAGFGGFLEQNWSIQTPDTLVLNGDSIPVVDMSSSSGGVSRVRFGGTYMPTDGVGIGLGLDLFTGSVDRVQGRSFGGRSVPTCCRSSWYYRGLGYTAGVHLGPTAATGLAISASYGGTLEATPRDDAGEAREYQLPLQLRGGMSGRVGENTLVALSAGWDGWSSLTDNPGSEDEIRNSWTMNGGIEWDAAVIRGQPIHLRLGARTGTLPFRWSLAGTGDGAGWASERAGTGGLGVLLGGGAVRADLSLEFGNRGGGSSGFDETFHRFGFSVRVLGR